jgi:hypothetical protein
MSKSKHLVLEGALRNPPHLLLGEAFYPSWHGLASAEASASSALTVEKAFHTQATAEAWATSYLTVAPLSGSLPSHALGLGLAAGVLAPSAASHAQASPSVLGAITVEFNAHSAVSASPSCASLIRVDNALHTSAAPTALTAACLTQTKRLASRAFAVSSSLSPLTTSKTLASRATGVTASLARIAACKGLASNNPAAPSAYANLSTLPSSPLWATKPFRIAGIPVEVPSALALTEAWSDQGGVAVKRMASGRDATAAYWTRKQLEISGEGQAPAGLDLIDWTQPQWVECAAPLSLPFAGLSAELPRARRTDCPVTVTALVDGGSVRINPGMEGDMATLGPVEGAYGYEVGFTPRFRALLTRTLSVDRSTGAHSWKITAEEL